jgi:hypothetical protein
MQKEIVGSVRKQIGVQVAGVPDRKNVIYPQTVLESIVAAFNEAKAAGKTMYGEYGSPQDSNLLYNINSEELRELSKRYVTVNMDNQALTVLGLNMVLDTLFADVEFKPPECSIGMEMIDALLKQNLMHLDLRGYSTCSISRGPSIDAKQTIMNFNLLAIDLVMGPMRHY